MHFCCVKTITLTDEAYERLAAWKESPKESFSKVVQKVVPKRGTLGDALDAVKKLPPLTPGQVKQMRQAIDWGNDWKNQRDPWTT